MDAQREYEQRERDRCKWCRGTGENVPGSPDLGECVHCDGVNYQPSRKVEMPRNVVERLR